MVKNKKIKLIVLAVLASITIGMIIFDAPYLYCLGAIIVTVVFGVEVFVRRPANSSLGLDNKHLGGGFYSGGRLPYMSNNRSTKGSGGVDAKGVKISGANSGGFFGQDR